MKKEAPKWKAIIIIALTFITTFAMTYEAYIRMVNS